MSSTGERNRILHLGSDPSEAALLAAELESESVPFRVTSVCSEDELRVALAANDVALIVADLPLPFESAAAYLSDLQTARPELQVVFRSGSTGNRTVTDGASHTLRAVREALARRGDVGRTPAQQHALIRQVVRHQAAQLRLSRRDFWDFDEAIRDITSVASELLAVRRVSYWEVDPRNSHLICRVAFDRELGCHTDGNQLELGPHYVNALERARFIAADDAQRDPRTSEFTQEYLSKLGITSMLDAPVRRDGRMVGVLCHEHIGPARHWSVLEQCTAAALADIMVRALEVRERRLAESRLREAEKFEVIGRLSGRLAHDFNNLLTVILGNAQLLLQRHGADSPDREGLVQILSAGEDATALIRQLLAYSRREVVPPSLLDLRAELTSILPMVRRLLGADVRVSSEFVAGPCWVEIDPTQLQQVLLNLTANARDAMPKGGELALTLEREAPQAAGPARFRLRVRDTGIGIAAEDLTRIFEPFFSTKETRLGTGLGLASVAEIVRRSGGEVTVRSRPGEGSTFEILLPEVGAPGSRAPLSQATGQARGKGPPNGRTALIVQADASLRRALSRQLAARSIGALEAGGPVEALEWLARGSRFDAVVSDFELPKMDGMRLIQHLRDFRPKLPAVLIAAPEQCSPAELDALRKSGATERLDTPPNAEALLGALGRLFS